MMMRQFVLSVVFVLIQHFTSSNGQPNTVLFSCTFESGSEYDACSFIQQVEDTSDLYRYRYQNLYPTQSYDWERHSGVTLTANTGPAKAHRGNWYFYVETSDPRLTGHEARINTRALNYRGDICVEFYYNMFGANMGTLRMFRQSGGGGHSRSTVWTRSQSQGRDWLQARVDVRLQGLDDRIGWAGMKGQDYTSDMAIDSITISSGTCSGGGGGPGANVNLPWICDFESEDICRMEQSGFDHFNWTRHTGETPSSNTGPVGAYRGQNYMYIETSSPRRYGDVAILRTPKLAALGIACLQFHYHMFGNEIYDLRVFISSTGEDSPVWVKEGNQGKQWHEAIVPVFLQAEDQINFQARRGTNIAGDIAIDYIRIVQGGCGGTTPTTPPTTPTPTPTTPRPTPPTTPPTTTPPSSSGSMLPFRCSFESGMCGMEQRANDEFDWTRQQGRTYTDSTGPGKAQDRDFYLYLEASAPRKTGDRTYIETPNLMHSGAVCLTFFYHMLGDTMGELSVFRASRGESDRLFSEATNKGNRWFPATVETTIIYGDRIVFRGVRGSDIRSDIAIDNLLIKPGYCDGIGTTTTPSPAEYDVFTCDAEGDGSRITTCQIRQDRGDDFDWSWRSGRTPSGKIHERRVDGRKVPVTGPESAQAGSYYLYVEASGRQAGQNARLFLQGDNFRRGGEHCLRFYYNMNGFHMGLLRVFTRTRGGPRIYHWTMAGDQLQTWHKGALDLNMDGITELGIEASVTGKFSGDMAIDSIRMDRGRCEPIPSQYIWYCRFELSDGAATLCGMEQDLRDTFDWTMWSGKTPSEFTGPGKAYNGDYYVFIEASRPRRNGDQARILMPRLNRSGTVCLQFFYHMEGFHTGSLHVFTTRGGAESPDLWSMIGEQGKQWFEARVTIDNLGYDDNIGFKGIRGTEYSGDIALDYIRVSRGRC